MWRWRKKGGSKATPIEYMFNSQPTKRFPLRVHNCSHPHFTLSHVIVEIIRCACALETELRVEEFQEIFQIHSLILCGWMSSHETWDKSRFQYMNQMRAPLGEIQYLFTVDISILFCECLNLYSVELLLCLLNSSVAFFVEKFQTKLKMQIYLFGRHRHSWALCCVLCCIFQFHSIRPKEPHNDGHAEKLRKKPNEKKFAQVSAIWNENFNSN